MRMLPAWSRLVLGVALIGATAWASVQAAESLKAEPTAVAVMDVKKAFNALDEKKQIESDLKRQQQQLRKQQQQKQQQLQDLKSDLDMLSPDSEAYRKKKTQLEKKALEYKSWFKFEKKKLERERIIQLEHIYRKLRDAAGRVAEENGYDLVLFKEPPVDFRDANIKEVSSIVQMRKLLWSSDELNITDRVIQKMNNEFQS